MNRKTYLLVLLAIVLLSLSVLFPTTGQAEEISCTVDYYQNVELNTGITVISDWIELDDDEFYLIDIDALSDELISNDDRVIISIKINESTSAEYMSDTQSDGYIASKSAVYLYAHEGIQIRYYTQTEQTITLRSFICKQ